MIFADLANRLEDSFGPLPRIFFARRPGESSSGEHTDYNDGFVMPCAIGFSTRVAISARADRKLVIQSREFRRGVIRSGQFAQPGKGRVVRLRGGIAVMLQQRGNDPRRQPAGAGRSSDWRGLSSSAAIEVASALAFISLNGTNFLFRKWPSCARRPKIISSARAWESWTSSCPAWGRPGQRAYARSPFARVQIDSGSRKRSPGDLQHHGET